MNRKFRNNYRGGWNDMPFNDDMTFNDFSQERIKKNYKIPHERSRHYAEDNRNSSHQQLADYADERNFPHQREKHCPVEMHLPRQREEHYADELHLLRQREEHYADEMHLPRQREEHYTDERNLPRQREEHYADERILPHQREEHYADERHLPRQREEHYADEMNFPRHREKHYADERHLPLYTGDRHLPRQREEHYAGERHFPRQREEHNADERHLPRYADDMHLPRQWEDHYSNERHIPNQTSEDCADKKSLARQRLKSTISVVAHNGKRHRMLLELREPSKKTSNRQESNKIPNSKINPVLPKSKKNWYSLENVSYEARIFKHRMIVLDERYERKLKDYNGAMDHGFRSDIGGARKGKNLKNKVGITSLMKSSKHEISALSNSSSNRTESMRTDFAVPLVPVTSPELSPPPAVRSSIEPKNHIDSQREVQKHVMEKNYAQHAVSMEFNAPPGFELLPSATESEKTKMPQACVCLTCGDKGFEETLEYCSKCKGYSHHSADSEEGGKDSSKECDARGEEHTSKECDVVVDSEPIAASIWNGTLKLFEKSFKLMGHLSTSASPKVHEKTSHLPDVLYADMLERSTVFPESFKRCGTNNHSIDLYFFPQDERDERSFDKLVDEIISNKLAIRLKVEKVDLLIFPSTMLPSQSKRFQSKYYLWGTFIDDASSGLT